MLTALVLILSVVALFGQEAMTPRPVPVRADRPR